MRYIGLDVHKDNITACFISAGGKVLENIEVPSDSDGLATILGHMNKEEHCTMMESSTYSYRVYRHLEDMSIETHVVHAANLKVVTMSDKKTDKNDAETIARYLRLWKMGAVKLSMAFIPTPDQCALKDICRYCEELSKKVGDESRRIKAHMTRNCMVLPETSKNLDTTKAMNFIRRTWPEDKTLIHRIGIFEQLLKEKKSIEKEVCSHMKGDSNVTLLESMFGIARRSGVQIMSMIIDVKRFPTSEGMCAYFGMVPRVHDSGGKKYHGKMTKKGDKMMRMIMERVTEVHVSRCNSVITEYYLRKLREMGKKKALVTTSRKMLTVIHAMLTKKEPFKA